MRIGIDATNIGGGGGVTHLKEILNAFDEKLLRNKVQKVIIFSSLKILNQLPEHGFYEKLTFPELNKHIYHRMVFQLFRFDKEIKTRCDILFSVTGDYIGSFKPVVGMSRNMILYDRNTWKEINQLKEIIRFWLIYQKQKYSFKNSDGIIFISNYAKKFISQQIDLKKKNLTIIHHGISHRFISKAKIQRPISEFSNSKPFKLLYVSTIHVFKNQWNVVKAVKILRTMGYPVELHLVGGVIFKPAGRKLYKTIRENDPLNEFIYNHGHVHNEEIDRYYNSSNGIIFASTCENMPNILIESMASGTPIACSNKQPMPEFLKDTGFYFNAHEIDTIVKALKELLDSHQKRSDNAKKALLEVSKYSWETTSLKTFEFIYYVYKNYQHV